MAIIRKNLSKDSHKLQKCIQKPELKTYFGDLLDEKVSRPPQGFEKDDPNIDLIKYKSLVFIKSKAFVGDYPELITELVDGFTRLYPFIDILREYLIKEY